MKGLYTQKNSCGDTWWTCKEDKGTETHTGEKQGPQGCVDKVEDLVAEKDAENREDEQNNQAHKKYAMAGCEVVFALWLKDKKSILTKCNLQKFKKHEQRACTSLNVQNYLLVVGADLKWEHDNSEADHRCDAHRYDDGVGVVEAGNHAHHVGEAQR